MEERFSFKTIFGTLEEWIEEDKGKSEKERR
jgi:hypothetical protein